MSLITRGPASTYRKSGSRPQTPRRGGEIIEKGDDLAISLTPRNVYPAIRRGTPRRSESTSTRRRHSSIDVLQRTQQFKELDGGRQYKLHTYPKNTSEPIQVRRHVKSKLLSSEKKKEKSSTVFGKVTGKKLYFLLILLGIISMSLLLMFFPNESHTIIRQTKDVFRRYYLVARELRSKLPSLKKRFKK